MFRRAIIAIFFLLFSSSAFAESVSIWVDVSSQTMHVTVDGVEQYNWPVSTARKGYYTPRGDFRPTRMAAVYYSKKYDNSPMPHSVFFVGGFAIHGTEYVRSLGRPASHGCVRLHPSNAALLYSLVEEYGAGNTEIHIRS
jgi:lipoprotein-anchoring transpeptidase ErfK/SrfK